MVSPILELEEGLQELLRTIGSDHVVTPEAQESAPKKLSSPYGPLIVRSSETTDRFLRTGSFPTQPDSVNPYY